MDNGCDAAALQLEPSFASHMIRAQVMAIMTAVVAGLHRGYDRLRKGHGLLPLGGGGGGKKEKKNNVFFCFTSKIFSQIGFF